MITPGGGIGAVVGQKGSFSSQIVDFFGISVDDFLHSFAQNCAGSFDDFQKILLFDHFDHFLQHEQLGRLAQPRVHDSDERELKR